MAWTTPRFTLRILLTALVTGSIGAIVVTDARMASAADQTENTEGATEAPAAEQPKWLVDEYGKEYRVEKFPKGVQGRDWIWLSEDDRIQVRYGIQYDIVGHDEDSFSIKLYKRPADASPPPPTPEEIEQVEWCVR